MEPECSRVYRHLPASRWLRLRSGALPAPDLGPPGLRHLNKESKAKRAAGWELCQCYRYRLNLDLDVSVALAIQWLN